MELLLQSSYIFRWRVLLDEGNEITWQWMVGSGDTTLQMALGKNGLNDFGNVFSSLTKIRDFHDERRYSRIEIKSE